MIRRYVVPVTPTGSAGSAAGDGRTDAGISGRLLAVHLEYAASTPATCDVTISAPGTTTNLLVVGNNATSGWYFPRRQMQDSTGAALTGIYEAVPIVDQIKVAVAQSDPNKTLTATLLVED